MLPFNAKSFLWKVANDTTTTENWKKYHWLKTVAFFLLANFARKWNLKIWKFLDEMVFGEVFNCPKDEKLKIENCRVSIFGFRRMMIKDLHVTFSKSSYRWFPLWLQTKKNPKKILGLRIGGLMFTSWKKKKWRCKWYKGFLFWWAHMNVREKFLEVTYLDNRNSNILPKHNRNLKFSNFL